MITIFRKSRYFQWILWITLFQVSNLSIDAPENEPEYYKEDLTFNEMESVVEIFLEVVLCMEDALPENQDNDDGQESTQNHKGKKTYIFSESQVLFSQYHSVRSSLIIKNFYYSQFDPPPFSPPPEIA